MSEQPDFSEDAEQAATVEVELQSAASVASEAHPEQNEDAFYTGQKAFVVCDGIGEFKSQLGSQAASEAIGQALDGAPCDLVEVAEALMKDAFKKGHEAAQAEQSPTTATAAMFWNNGHSTYLTVGRVGDSFALHIRNGELTLLSWPRDKFPPEEALRESLGLQSTSASDLAEKLRAVSDQLPPGWSDDQSASNYLQRGRHMTAGIGSENEKAPTVSTTELQPGDKILLATDGIFDPLTLDDIKEKVLAGASADELIAAANARPWPERAKKDDRTAVIVGCK